jgi:(E)-4-hydroxy-3-methylbut-2-enyl-diphosphate synthase
MADANYGCVGNANGNINLYKAKELITKNIKLENALESLINLIKQNGDWKEV